MALSLVSINIEGVLHVPEVLAFLEKQNPDVVCLQELLETDIPRFEEALGTTCFYAPMMRLIPGTRLAQNTELVTVGVGIFSKVPRSNEDQYYYHRALTDLPAFVDGTPDQKRDTQHCVVALASVEKEGKTYRIATTHFTWTPNGEADDYQREDTAKLLAFLKNEESVILCGDMNAPRGKEIFSTFAAQYKDNIPASYKTSLDISIHRAGATVGEHLSTLMVDALFTSPQYETSAVALVPGISDHCAIVATIDRV